MGFLQSIGKIISQPLDAIGNVTGVHISPSGVNVGAPKLGLTDLITLGSMFAGPGGIAKAFSDPKKFFTGLSSGNVATNLGLGQLVKGNILPYLASVGIKDPSKMTPQEIALLLGSMSGAVSADGTISPVTNPQQNAVDTAATMLLPLLLGQIGNVGASAAGYEAARKQAFDALDPALNSSRSESTRSSLVGGAKRQGSQQAKNLAANGYDPSFGLGFTLGLVNNANSAANQSHIAASDPQYIANQAGARLGLASPGTVAPLLQTMIGLTGSQDALANSALNRSEVVRRAKLDNYQNGPPSFLETLFGIGGQLGPAIFNNQKSNKGIASQSASGGLLPSDWDWNAGW